MKNSKRGSAMLMVFMLGITCMMILGMTVHGLLISVKWTSLDADKVKARAAAMTAERPESVE